MSVLRIDSIGGASGNMLLGALIGLGVDRDRLLSILRELPIEGWTRLRRSSNQPICPSGCAP